MSALGHSRRCHQHESGSTCPLPPKSGQTAVRLGKSALCQQRTHALQQTSLLFDHLVGAGEQRGWHGEAERLCGLEIDHQFEFGRLLNGQVGRLGTSENAIDVRSCSTKHIVEIDAI